MDKLISEFRFVETDDGYRIEIKGDKDAMRKMMKGFHGKHGHYGPGHFFFRRHARRAMAGWGPWMMEEAGPDAENDAAEA